MHENGCTQTCTIFLLGPDEDMNRTKMQFRHRKKEYLILLIIFFINSYKIEIPLSDIIYLY